MIQIAILINGETVGGRKWPTVPRAGDSIRMDAVGTKPYLIEVIDVVWWNGPDGECRVDLICEKVTQ